MPSGVMASGRWFSPVSVSVGVCETFTSSVHAAGAAVDALGPASVSAKAAMDARIISFPLGG
jgi:hypothetical protein